MSQIQGLAAHAAGAELLPFHYDPGRLGSDEVEIAITHCGVCHSDLHLIANDWGVSQFPFIPGHEIIGTVSAVGSRVKTLKAGQRVGLGWQSNSCGHCEWCTRGLENLCPNNEATCVHRNGGYADSVRANSRFVIPIPEALASENAAPLLCGGITVYNPMRIHGVNPSSRVGIIGIGGLGHLAIQFARAFGAQVTAFSTSADKEEEARALGAHNFVNSRESKAMKEVAGTQDFHPQHRQRRPGLGRLHPDPAPHRNALFCRRSTLAGLHSGLSAHLRPALHQRQPHRPPKNAAGDARRSRPPRRHGKDRSLPHGQSQRSHR
jgi:uncharacterized zinc-type alcohol dehydrogenase-like protein